MGQGAGPARGCRRAGRARRRGPSLVQDELDRANAHYASVEQIKKFTILPRELSIEEGELTPTLKIKRAVVNERYAELFDSLYGG